MKVEVDYNRTKFLIHLVLVGRGRVFFFLVDSSYVQVGILHFASKW